MKINQIDVAEYVNKGLDIIPVQGKRPYTKDWYTKDFIAHPEYYIWKGIGLKMGEASNIICLDFDSTDSAVKDAIKPLLPPIYSGKVGNPDKLSTMFFKYDGETSIDLRDIEVQLLSTGKQTVLPPSMHPTIGKPFTWRGKSLLEIDIDSLPNLDNSVWESLLHLNETQGPKLTTASTISTGRNNALKAQVVASIVKGKSIDETIQEVITYDQMQHSPPLFHDASEPYMKGSIYQNALGFVCRIAGSLAKNTKVVIEPPFNSITAKPLVTFGKDFSQKEEPAKKKYLKLPKLPGLGADIFKELYDGAPIPRSQFAFQNAVYLASLLIGNRATYKGTGMNLYTYAVGPSASGKDYPFKRGQMLIKLAQLDRLIGPSSPTSETSILKFLEENREKGCWWNEGEKVLKLMACSKQNHGVLECVTDIYDDSGKSYFNKGTINQKGELSKFGDIFSPFLSISMASTTKAFNVNANTSMFETGLLNRFDIFFEDRHKRLVYRDDYSKPVSSTLIQKFKDLSEGGPLLDDSKQIIYIPKLIIDPNTDALSREIFEQIVEDNEKYRGGKFEGFVNRKYLRANKYAGLHHFMVHQNDFKTTPVGKESILWGYNTATAIMSNMLQNLPFEVSDSDYERSLNLMLTKIKRLNASGKVATKSTIANGLTSIKVSLRNEILKDLLEQEVIMLSKERGFVYNRKI